MKDVLGYADRLSVRPGDSIEFKVSVVDGRPFRAQLVRLAGGDASSPGEELVEHEVASNIDGVYAGRFQETYPGSCVVVDVGGDWPVRDCLTVAINFMPTFPHGERQHLISHLDPETGAGWSLHLDDGRLTFEAGGGHHDNAVARLPDPVVRGSWYRAVATVDADAGRLELASVRVPSGIWERGTEPSIVTVPLRTAASTPSSPLVIGARLVGFSPTGNVRSDGSFEGRLETPAVVAAALDRRERDEILAGRRPPISALSCAGDWDFSDGIDTLVVTDRSPAGRHGRLHNLPLRGVRGSAWTGTEFRWRHAPQEYSAIAFHTDDLADCDWETDARWLVPDDLRSGVYALRLRLDDSVGSDLRHATEDYIPFVIAPPRAAPSSDTVFLLPTNTYLAYGNVRNFHRVVLESDLSYEEYDRGTLNGPGLAVFGYTVADHPHLGLSMYDHHRDGTPVHFSTALRPLLNMRPKGMMWNFSADLLIIEWLETTGAGYDVVTDEILESEGADALDGYRLVITGNHPEYITTPEWDAIEGHLAAGGRLMYLGGNGFYWRCATHSDAPGVLELRRGRAGTGTWVSEVGESDFAFTGETGGLWRELGRPPQRLVGVGFTAEGAASAPFRVFPDALAGRAEFLLAGVEADMIGRSGVFGGAAGQEIDRSRAERGTPVHAIVVARSEGHGSDMITAVEELNPSFPVHDAYRSEVFAEVVFFELPSGGAVFSVGSMAWCGSLREAGYDNDVARVTGNALARMRDPAAFEMPGERAASQEADAPPA